jgi:hypothetical protein
MEQLNKSHAKDEEWKEENHHNKCYIHTRISESLHGEGSAFKRTSLLICPLPPFQSFEGLSHT